MANGHAGVLHRMKDARFVIDAAEHADVRRATTTHHQHRVTLVRCADTHPERFDAFASLPHMPMFGGRTFQAPLTAMGAAYYALRDRLGI